MRFRPKLFGAPVRNGHANQSASVRGHEIHRFCGNFLRGHDQVALVLTVGIICHNHHFARRDVGDNVVHRVEFECFGGCYLRNHKN